MLTWFSGFFKPFSGGKAKKLPNNDSQKNKKDEDWMMIGTDLKSCTESEHAKSSFASKNPSSSLLTGNGKKNGNNNGHFMSRNTNTTTSIAIATTNITPSFNNNGNNGLGVKVLNHSDDLLLTLKDREQKMKKDRKLGYRKNYGGGNAQPTQHNYKFMK